MTRFNLAMREDQVAWRRRALENQTRGRQNGREYDHILPRELWEENLWPGIRAGSANSLPAYLKDNAIRPHTGVHNLCSSWVLCANLYFPFRTEEGRVLVAAFLRREITDVTSCEAIELEYEHADADLHPHKLLGEGRGSRGSGQTSPDVAFLITTRSGPGVVLVESKFSEHWFYQCSAYRPNPKGRVPNPDRSRCTRPQQVLRNPDTQCHAASWGRKYWHRLRAVTTSDALGVLACCPAATGAYQLIRQQALAEAFASSGRFSRVVSAVAYDARNAGLFRVLRTTAGAEDVRKLWAQLFPEAVRFWTFAHQDWVSFVAANDKRRTWSNWLDYITRRYGYHPGPDRPLP